MQWIEAVPNFSEGRDVESIEAIAQAMRGVPGAHVLHVDSERDTHRTVMTLMGHSSAVEEALFRGIRCSLEHIDLCEHAGSHPRMGAADVIPFVPWGEGVQMAEAVSAAHRLGQRVGSDLGLPGWFYGAAARSDSNRYLHDIRRGQFEGLSKKLATKQVDFGPQEIHPTGGASAIGARGVLVAMNCTLDTEDVRLAKALAARIRELQHVRRSTDGEVTRRESIGLPGLRALGWFSERDGRAQVTMNLTDVQRSPPHVVFEALRKLGDLTRTQIVGTELIGMIPRSLLLQAGAAMDPSASDAVAAGIRGLRLGVLHDFQPQNRIVERAMEAQGLVDFPS